jgi:hypothetical protein
MADPLRLVVHKRLTALLETITYADFDGTEIAMTDRVYRGRGVFGDETPIPAISILESPIPEDTGAAPHGGGLATHRWELVVQGFVRDDRRNPTDPAHILLAQVKQVLAQETQKVHWDRAEDGILGLGRSVDDMQIGAGVVRPADELSSKAYFWLVLTLKMVEDLTDPYGGL